LFFGFFPFNKKITGKFTFDHPVVGGKGPMRKDIEE